MSKARPPARRGKKLRGIFVIVASRFNEEFVDGLIAHATAEFEKDAGTKVRIVRVPGAFEIPVAVQAIAREHQCDAILALAVILRGETDHAAHLAHSVTNALQQIALAENVPVINGVLSLTNAAQARARCLGDRINRGTEAAAAAFEIAGVMRELRLRN